LSSPEGAEEPRAAAALVDLRPLRVSFVGQAVYFEQCYLEAPAGGLVPTFIDFRAGVHSGPLLGALQAVEPDVVLVFRPEIIPRGLFDSVHAVTIGYLTEPLPRTGQAGHADLHERMETLKRVDAGNFDRVASFDPLIAESAGSVLPIWRSLPLPVSDSLFMDVHERSKPPRLLFLGRSTQHREELLAPIKRAHSIVHIGHGLSGPMLHRYLRRADVQLNLHNNPYPSFENRVSLALAAGHLVISEPLSPRHDLRPGRDYLEADNADSIKELVDEVMSDPSAFLDVQRSGREQAERFRASRVYPTLIRDAVADVETSGSLRRARSQG
jgi:hypothetical protein